MTNDVRAEILNLVGDAFDEASITRVSRVVDEILGVIRRECMVARVRALQEAAVACDHVTYRCFDQRDQQKVGAYDCAVELAAAIRAMSPTQPQGGRAE